MKFRIQPHALRPGVEVVEVYDDSGHFIATVSPGDDDREVRVTSKYIRDYKGDDRGVPHMVLIRLCDS